MQSPAHGFPSFLFCPFSFVYSSSMVGSFFFPSPATSVHSSSRTVILSQFPLFRPFFPLPNPHTSLLHPRWTQTHRHIDTDTQTHRHTDIQTHKQIYTRIYAHSHSHIRLRYHGLLPLMFQVAPVTFHIGFLPR
jgi:hypothetical protein